MLRCHAGCGLSMTLLPGPCRSQLLHDMRLLLVSVRPGCLAESRDVGDGHARALAAAHAVVVAAAAPAKAAVVRISRSHERLPLAATALRGAAPRKP